MGNIEDQNDPQISPGRALDALSIKGSIPLFEHYSRKELDFYKGIKIKVVEHQKESPKLKLICKWFIIPHSNLADHLVFPHFEPTYHPSSSAQLSQIIISLDRSSHESYFNQLGAEDSSEALPSQSLFKVYFEVEF